MSKLRLCLATLALLIILFVSPRLLAKNAPRHTFETVHVADGVVAFIASESDTNVVSGNCVAIIGDDGILVVDSTSFPSHARQIIAELREMTNQPVRFLVHTHWHPDHLIGDGEFVSAFPGVAIISTTFTQNAIAELAPKYIKGIAEHGADYGAQLRKRIQDGKDKNGQPLSDDDKRYFSDEANSVDFATPEYRQYKTIVPNVTFDDALTIRLGKREVRLLFLGKGNTSGDAVIFVPDAKVVVTGDLLVAPTPYSYGSYLTDWVATLGKIRALGAAHLIPGHGPVEHDNSYLDLVSSALQYVTSQVQAAATKHLSLEDTQKQIDLTSFRDKFCGHDHDREIAFRTGFTNQAIRRAYDEIQFKNED